MSFGNKYNTRGGAYSNSYDDNKPSYGRSQKFGSYRGQFSQQKLDFLKDTAARQQTYYSTDILCQSEYKEMSSLRIRCEDYFLISQNLLDKEGLNVVQDAMSQIKPRFSRRVFANQNPQTQQRPPCSAKFEQIPQFKEAPKASTIKIVKYLFPQDDSKAFESDNKNSKSELPDTKLREEMIVTTIGNSYKNPISGIDEKKLEVIVKKVVKENQNAPQSRDPQLNNRNNYGNSTNQNAFKQTDGPIFGQNPPAPIFQQTQNLAANQQIVPNIFQQNAVPQLFNNNQNANIANPLASIGNQNQIKPPWSQTNTANNNSKINIFDKMNKGQSAFPQQGPLFQQNNMNLFPNNSNQNPFIQQNSINPFGQQNSLGQQNSYGQQNIFGQQNTIFNQQSNQQNFDSKYILSTNQKGFRQFEQFYNANYNQNNYTDEQILEIFKQVVNKFSEAESKYKGNLVMNKNNQQIFQFHPEEEFDDFMKAEKYQTQAQALKMAIENVHNQPLPTYHCNPQGIMSIEVLPYNGTFNLENQSYIVVPDSIDPKKVKLIPTEEVYKFTQNLSNIHQLNKTPVVQKDLKYQQLESFEKRIIKFDNDCDGEDLDYMNSLKQKIYQEQKLGQTYTKNQQEKPQQSQNQKQVNQIPFKLVQSEKIEEVQQEKSNDDEQERKLYIPENDNIKNQSLYVSRLVGEKFTIDNDTASNNGFQSTRAHLDDRQSILEENNQNTIEKQNVSNFEDKIQQEHNQLIEKQYVYHLKIVLQFLEFEKSFNSEFVIIEAPYNTQQVLNFIVDKIWQNQQITEEEKQCYKNYSKFFYQNKQLQNNDDIKQYLKETEINDIEKKINNFRIQMIRTATVIFDPNYTYVPEIELIQDFTNVPYLCISNQYGMVEWQNVDISFMDFRNLLVIKPDTISMYQNIMPYLKPEVDKKLNTKCKVTFYIFQQNRFLNDIVAKQKCKQRGHEYLGKLKLNNLDAYQVILQHFSEHQFFYLYESDNDEEQYEESYDQSDQEEDLPYIDQFQISESETKIHNNQIPDLRQFQDYERPVRRKAQQDEDHQQMIHELIDTLCCDDENSIDDGVDLKYYQELNDLLDDKKSNNQDQQFKEEQQNQNFEETLKKEQQKKQVSQELLEDQLEDVKQDDQTEMIEILENEIKLLEAQQKYDEIQKKRQGNWFQKQTYQNNYRLNFEPYEIVLLEQNKLQTDPISKNILILFFQDVYQEFEFPQYSFSKSCMNIIYILNKLQEEYIEYEWNNSIYFDWIPCIELLNILFGNSPLNLIKTTEKMKLEEILIYQEDLFGDANNLIQRKVAFTHWCQRQLQINDPKQIENEWPFKKEQVVKQRISKIQNQSWWDEEDIPFKKVTNLKQAIYVLFRERISNKIINANLKEDAIQFIIKDSTPLSYIFWFILAKEQQKNKVGIVSKVSSLAKIEQMSQYDGLQDIVAMFIDVLTEKCEIFSLKERVRIRERIALHYGSGTESLSKSHFIGYSSESREFTQKAFDMNDVPGHGLMVDQYILPYLACYDLELAKEVAKECTESNIATQALLLNGNGNVREQLLSWPKSDVFWQEFKEIMMNLL